MKRTVQNSALRKLIEAKELRKNVAQRRDPNGMSYETWNSQQALSN